MNRSLTPAFLLAFLLLLAVVIMNQTTSNQMRAYTARVERTREIILAYTNLSNDLKSAQIFTPSARSLKAPSFYQLYQQDMERVPDDLEQLRWLVRGDTLHDQRVKLIERMVGEQLPSLKQYNIVELIDAGQAWRLEHLFAIHREIRAGIEQENAELGLHKATLDRLLQATNLLTVVLSIIAIVVTLLIFLRNNYLRLHGQRLEGFLERIMKTSRNGIVVYRAVYEQGKIADFRIEYANPVVENLLGLRLEDIIGKTLAQLETSYVRNSPLFEWYKTVIMTGEQQQFETHYTHGDFKSWMHVMLARHEADGVMATFYDINALKQYESELRQKIEELEVSNRELEQYAYVASHDLQEPLRKIQLYGGFLEKHQRDRLDESGQMHLERIVQSAARMSELITDILNFSSLKKELRFSPTDLNELLDNVLDDLSLVVEQKSARIEAGRLPVIAGIPLQLNQLLYNLVNNALKFARPGVPPVVILDARPLDAGAAAQLPGLEPDRQYWEIAVRDNGIGFSADYAEQIFGLFKRLNDQRTFPGSGIGLALCRKVVQNHGGMVWAEGRENEGATFFVILPAWTEETA